MHVLYSGRGYTAVELDWDDLTIDEMAFFIRHLLRRQAI